MQLLLNNLSTGYRQKHTAKTVSAGIHATLEAGQLTCLLGPNGAGKSTLLRTLAGFQPPLAGEILVDGVPVSSLSREKRARTFGVVLTDHMHLTGMTAREVVSLGRSPYNDFWGRLTAHDHEVVGESLATVGAADLAERQMQTLSDGERQKVMIAKALAQQTPFVFLDEPTAFLDYPSKVRTLMLLKRLTRTMGKTILLSTHDIEHAMALSDQVWLLDGMHGLTAGTVERLSEEGQINRYFDDDALHYDARQRRFLMQE